MRGPIASAPAMPPPRQLELIPWENPLGARLGPEFFQELPPSPGVYRMLSREAEVLYVGSSRHLRQRVSSYRSISPGRHSRRLCRLVHQVAAVIIEPTLQPGPQSAPRARVGGLGRPR